MLKTSSGLKALKLAKKKIITILQSGSNLFLTLNAKKSFQKLKQAFCKEPVLQHFDVFKPIQVETNASRKVIKKVLCQQNIDIN